MSESATGPSPSIAVTELRVPHPRRVTLAGLATTVALIAVLYCFLACAIDNLLHPHHVPWVILGTSLLWILLVVTVIVGLCWVMGGLGAWLVRILGVFARRQFVRIETLEPSGERVLALGFRFASVNFYYRKIALDGITGVNWNAGQASHRLKQELDDWSVAVWYDPSAVRSRPTPDHQRPSEKALDLLGSPGSKASAEKLGFELVELLRHAGVSLTAGEERMKFVRG